MNTNYFMKTEDLKDKIIELLEKFSLNYSKEFLDEIKEIPEFKELEKTQQKLKENNERYSTAQRIGNVGNWEYNVKTGEFWGSEQAKRIYGFDPNKDNFTTDEVESCIPERERIHQALIDLIETDKEYNLEFRIIPKNSRKEKVITSIAQLQKDNKGNPLKVVGVIQDITERKNAQQAIAKSEEKYRKLVENQGEGIAISNENEIFTFSNPAADKIFGVKKGQLVGKSILDFLSPTEQKRIKTETSKRKKGMKSSYELEIRCPNGKIKIISITVVPELDKNGKYISSFGIFRDITEQKETEKRLIENEEKFRTITNSAQDAIILIDNDGKVIHWNKSAEKIFKFTYKEALNRNLHKLITPKKYWEAHEKVFKLFQKSGKGNAVNQILELTAKRKDGTEIPVELSLSALKLNNTWHAVGILRDISERIKNQKELAASEDRFKILSQLTFEGIVIHKNGVSIDCNQSFLNLLKYDKVEVINKSVLDYIDKEYHEIVKENIVKNTATPYEVVAIRKDGIRIPVEIEARNVKIKDETIRVAAIRDITERKKNQKTILESEEKFRTLAASSPVGVYLTDTNGKCTYANPRWLEMAGMNLNNALGYGWEKAIHPDDKPWVSDKWYKSIKSQGKWSFEYRFINKKGKTTWVNGTANSIKDSSGNIIGYVGINTDISERKKTEEKLRELLKTSEKSQSEVSELLHATHAILKSGEFNKVAREIFDACKRAIGAKAGYVAMLSDDGAENELLFLDDGGLPCDVNPELPMPIRGLRAEAYKTGKVVYDNNFMESKWVKYMPKNHLYLKNVLFAPLIVGNKTIGLIGISNKDGDFTEEDARLAMAFAEYASIALQNARNLEELENNNKQLQELNATKDKFFSIIAHDLRGPANNLVGFADLLERNYLKYDKDKLSHIINLMSSAAKSTFKLLENLLIWSRSQRNSISYKPEKFLCKELVKEVIEEMQHLAFAKQINLITDKNPGHFVSADKDMFKTVYRNLISNAIKFTHEGGEISIGCGKVTDKFVEFFISDNGIGIPKENLDKIFKIDKNITTVGTNDEKGTGLGLILCKDFIEKHGGKIWVKSEENKGTSFWFTFPKADND